MWDDMFDDFNIPDKAVSDPNIWMNVEESEEECPVDTTQLEEYRNQRYSGEKLPSALLDPRTPWNLQSTPTLNPRRGYKDMPEYRYYHKVLPDHMQFKCGVNQRVLVTEKLDPATGKYSVVKNEYEKMPATLTEMGEFIVDKTVANGHGNQGAGQSSCTFSSNSKSNTGFSDPFLNPSEFEKYSACRMPNMADYIPSLEQRKAPGLLASLRAQIDFRMDLDRAFAARRIASKIEQNMSQGQVELTDREIKRHFESLPEISTSGRLIAERQRCKHQKTPIKKSITVIVKTRPAMELPPRPAVQLPPRPAMELLPRPAMQWPPRAVRRIITQQRTLRHPRRKLRRVWVPRRKIISHSSRFQLPIWMRL